MFCNKCGKQIADDSLFCNYCGEKVNQLEQDNKPKDRDDLIIDACKNCVEKHLKSPSSANYISIDIKDYDDYGRIYLEVELDSQNSFGASIRTKLRVVLQSVNDNGTYEAFKDAVAKMSFFATEDVVKSVNKWNKPK